MKTISIYSLMSLFLLYNVNLCAQDVSNKDVSNQEKPKSSLAVGVGFYEFLHVGLRHNVSNDVQVGIYAGTFLGFTLSGEVRKYIGKKSKYTDRGMFYGRASITRISMTERSVISWEGVAIGVGSGYEYNFSSKHALEFDLGVSYLVSTREKSDDLELGPGFGLRYVYRW